MSSISRRDFFKALLAVVLSPALLIPDLKRRAYFAWARLTSHPAAANSVNEFTRQKMREEGFIRRLLPPIPIANNELDRSLPANS